jgi:cation transport ATPase
VVLSGRAVADEAMLTGEAALVPKQTGDRVSVRSHTPAVHLCSRCAGGMIWCPLRNVSRSDLADGRSLATTWSQVTAGTVNYEGVLTIEASSTGQDSTLAGIAALVAEAQVGQGHSYHQVDGHCTT